MGRKPPRGSLWPVGAGAIAVAAGLSGGCSVVFHEDPGQCSSDADCLARGAAFANTTCDRPSKTCIASSAMTDGGSDGQDGSDGAAPDAGPPCTTYADCQPLAMANHPEITCSPDTHTCVQLTNDSCPYYFGDYQYSKHVAPIVIGAFATLPSGNPTDHPSYRNYKLAIDEFTSQGGIPAGPGNALRMPVAVICNDDLTQTDAAMQHLVNDVHVSAVIPALDSADLRVTFNNYGFNTAANLLVVNPFGADSTLTSLTRGQQLWHMLGRPDDTAPAYRALFPRIESYIRNNPPWSLGASSPMRVATVTAAGTTVLSDLAGAVGTQPISWNNGNAQFSQTPTPYYQAETLSGSTLSGTPLNQIDVSSAVNDLVAFKPQVVISFACDEFVTLLQTLDLQWPSSSPPPLYVLGPYNADSRALLQWVGNSEGKRRRLVGINFASTTATGVLNAYESRFTMAGNPASALGSENYYDAMYFVIDSLVGAAGSAGHAGPLTGTDLGAGMLRLISSAATPYNMGPTDMGDVFTALASTNSSISLTGALGPPLFNTGTGARVGQGDAYCVAIHAASDAGPASTVFTPDVLRLSPSPDGGAPVLAGDASCYPGL